MTRTPPALVANSLQERRSLSMERRRSRRSLAAVNEVIDAENTAEEQAQVLLRTHYSDSAAAFGASTTAAPRHNRRNRNSGPMRRVSTAPTVASPNTSACGSTHSAQALSHISQALSDQTNSYSIYRMFPDRRGTASATAAVSSPSRHYREHGGTRKSDHLRQQQQRQERTQELGPPVQFELSPHTSAVDAQSSRIASPTVSVLTCVRSGSLERRAGKY